MDHFFFYHDNLAVVSDLEKLQLEKMFNKTLTLPNDKQDLLGDPVIFKIPSKDQLSTWMIGRFCPVDLMVEPLDFNIPHVFYHRFPEASYLYIQENISLSEANALLKSADANDQDWDIVYPPILSFPSDLPNSMIDSVAIDIWTATTAELENNPNYVKKAKPYRSYSFNYVSALLDFTNLPDYDQ